MKTARWNLLMVALFLATPFASSEEIETPHVTVYGTSTVQVVPNQMIWSLTVRSEDPTSTSAAKMNEKTVGDVLSFLKSEVAAESVQTAWMQLGENWKYVGNTRVKDGYFGTTEIHFTISNLTKYSMIWIGLAGIQGVQVTSVSLSHSERIKFQNEARTKAVVAAKEKAKAIAEALGSKIGEPLSIDEDLSVSEGYRALSVLSARENPILSNSVSFSGSASVDSDPSVAPGSIPIRSRVKAIFSLLK